MVVANGASPATAGAPRSLTEDRSQPPEACVAAAARPKDTDGRTPLSRVRGGSGPGAVPPRTMRPASRAASAVTMAAVPRPPGFQRLHAGRGGRRRDDLRHVVIIIAEPR